MTLEETLSQLEAYGTEQNRKVYPRHGVKEPMYGVSYANLGKMKKAIESDHALALALWKTGNHDARVLATMIADPKASDEAMLNAWVHDLDNYVLTDALGGFAAKSPAARASMETWIPSDDEWIGRAGWHILANLAMKDTDLSDAYLTDYIEAIEREIHRKPNKTRDGMNGALIAIGLRNEQLEKRALAAARKIGRVEVDHGETSCKTPDVASYIARVKERNRKKSPQVRNSAS
jgi:3-methyladenine DNA glycosylase AlkD